MQLLSIEGEGAYIGVIQRKGFDEGLEPQEVKSVTEVVAGVTRWRRRLDFIIESVSVRRINKIEPVLHQILRLGTPHGS
jgi:16S rRNA (cytosine967-C5)-methyltransferase